MISIAVLLGVTEIYSVTAAVTDVQYRKDLGNSPQAKAKRVPQAMKMDDIFNTAEQKIAGATTPAEVKQAVAHLLIGLFGTARPALAEMGKVMMVTLERANDLEGKRIAAQAFIRMLNTEFQQRGKQARGRKAP